MGGRDIAIALVLFAGLAARGERFESAHQELGAVRVARCDGGAVVPFDLGRVEKNYRSAATGLQRALSRFERTVITRIDDGYDAGLPDPVGTGHRRFRPSKAIPPELRGLTIYVVTVDRNGVVRGLAQGVPNRNDVVLISRTARLKDCAGLAPVTLLTRELAAALGIRSSRCRLVVSADGSEVEITEGDPP